MYGTFSFSPDGTLLLRTEEQLIGWQPGSDRRWQHALTAQTQLALIAAGGSPGRLQGVSHPAKSETAMNSCMRGVVPGVTP